MTNAIAMGIGDRQMKSRRGAERIRNDLGAFGKVGLLEVVLRHVAIDGREHAPHRLDARLMAKEFATGNACDRFGGEVVGWNCLRAMADSI